MPFLEDAYTEILLLEIDTYCIDNAPERVWNLDRDMKGWRVGERPDVLFDNEDSDNDLKGGMRPWEIGEVDDAIYFKLGKESVCISFIFSLTPARVKKNLDVVKKAVTRKNTCWSSRGWLTKTSWQRSRVDDECQSCQDKWRKPAPQAKSKEVSQTVEELGMMAKEKKGPLVKSCKESSKRESEVLVMAEELALCGKNRRTHQGHNKAIIKRRLKTTP